MNSGSISYSPDYKSEKERVADHRKKASAAVLRIMNAQQERARLEREVIRCARLFTKIKDGPLDATWVDRTALADNDLDDAVRKLETFEAEQEKKS